MRRLSTPLGTWVRVGMLMLCFITSMVCFGAVVIAAYGGNLELAILYAVLADIADRNSDYWRDKE